MTTEQIIEILEKYDNDSGIIMTADYLPVATEIHAKQEEEMQKIKGLLERAKEKCAPTSYLYQDIDQFIKQQEGI